ncbi:GNAT family N-acetyltransferase [Legionella sp.]|uniref:GNAT family N-acetyltransferase n=1 Tax=Legionella sp. TaxID=459 RepID=UPI003C8A8AF8
MPLLIKKVFSAKEIQQCMDIRNQIFVKGQNVPISEEVDGNDEDSEHYLLLIDEQPAGVARVRFMGNFAKIERLAILDKYQGKGFGKKLMQKILLDLLNNEVVTVAKLSSQTHAIPFYEKLGFVVCSEEYMDANIPHKEMQLNFNPLHS